MHTFYPWIVSRRNELLCISVCEQILVVPLFEEARDGRVPVFNVKTTTEAYIPIVVYFIDVGEIQFFCTAVAFRGGGCAMPPPRGIISVIIGAAPAPHIASANGVWL